MKRTVTFITGKTSTHVLSAEKLQFILDTFPNHKVEENLYKINGYHLRNLQKYLDNYKSCSGNDLHCVTFFNGDYKTREIDEVDFRIYLNRISFLCSKISENVYKLSIPLF